MFYHQAYPFSSDRVSRSPLSHGEVGRKIETANRSKGGTREEERKRERETAAKAEAATTTTGV